MLKDIPWWGQGLGVAAVILAVVLSVNKFNYDEFLPVKKVYRHRVVLPVLACVIIIAGLFAGVVASVETGFSRYLLGAIAIGFVMGGVVVLIYCKNWFLLVREDELVARTVTREIIRIRFDEVTNYSRSHVRSDKLNSKRLMSIYGKEVACITYDRDVVDDAEILKVIGENLEPKQ